MNIFKTMAVRSVEEATQSIPVIDFGPAFRGEPGGLDATVAKVRHACEHVGFFYLAGHGVPEGVLIRGIFAGTAAEGTFIAGPGKVCRHLAIDKTLDGTDAVISRDLWLEDRGVRIAARRIRNGPRVGVDYAGPYWAARPWRFSIDAETIRAALAAR